ncbi:MAG: M48 family metallopeptidase [Planctomycetota bacterium]|nr:M48 family metallopeptidase [Planctomycetota bacterium]
MTESPLQMSVTGHGGKFGVSAPATLEISGSHAVLTGRDGESESIDLYQAGASVLGTCISVEDPQSLVAFSTRDPMVITQLRSCCPVELVDEIDEGLKSLQKSMWSGWKVLKTTVLVIGVLAGLGYGFYLGVAALARMAIQQLPIEIDHAIGDAAHRSILSSETLIRDPQVTETMQQILDSLRPHIGIDGMDPKIVVVENDEVNAYCLPGGFITMNTGLLRAAEGPDEVAGVLAHEIAHATLRHGVKQLAQTLTLVTAIQVVLGDASGVLALGTEGAEFLVRQGYSRDHEREADLEGLRIVIAAGWNPEAMAAFFEKLARQNDGRSPPAWFSTHPDPGQRASTIRQHAAQNPPSSESPPSIDWQSLQRALAK